jgi:hypothetical protein
LFYLRAELDDRGVVAFAQASVAVPAPLDNLATVKKLVAFYVTEHNGTLPHSAFEGQTPMRCTLAVALGSPMI